MVLSTGTTIISSDKQYSMPQSSNMISKARKFVEPNPLEFTTKIPLLQVMEDSEPEDGQTLRNKDNRASISLSQSIELRLEPVLLEEDFSELKKESSEITITIANTVDENREPKHSMELRKSSDLRRSLDLRRSSMDGKRPKGKRYMLKRVLRELDPRTMTLKGALKLGLLVVLLAGITTFLGLLIGSNNLQIAMLSILEWLSRIPKWGSSLIMSFMYCGALLLFCPGTPFNLAAGFLFGMYLGTAVAIGGCIMGAMIAFLLGRTIARDWVKSKMEQRPKFKAVDWAIQKNGVYIIFLTRLSPLFPFPLLNYAFGITKVSVLQYFIGTLAGVTPATIGYTYLGTLMRNLTDVFTTTSNGDDQKSNQNPNFILLIVGSVLTLLSIIIISFITKRAIDKATAEYAKQEELDKEKKLAQEISKSLEAEEMQSVHPQVKLDEISP